jgi:ubiquitin-conjugating enzyme E2 J2
MPLLPQGVKRLQKDFLQFQRDPPPFISAAPDGDNLAIWYFVIEGPPDSLYNGGLYLGKLVFPDNYPFAPPRIEMITPNGRFEVNTRLCLSISDYHPESWSPMWGPSTILTGVLSFMLEETDTLGAIKKANAAGKAKAAAESHAFNLAHPKFTALFPQLVVRCSTAVTPSCGVAEVKPTRKRKREDEK